MPGYSDDILTSDKEDAVSSQITSHNISSNLIINDQNKFEKSFPYQYIVTNNLKTNFSNGFINSNSILNTDSKFKLYFIGETSMPTKKGNFRVRAYRDTSNNSEPLVLISGNQICPIKAKNENAGKKENVLVRVHDQCFTSEIFGSLRCDCKDQLDYAMDKIQKQEDGGIIIYTHQEGRGIGLANKILAYQLQDQHGLDTIDANIHLNFGADQRQYECIPYILKDCGISSINLMTNNPRKISLLKKLGVKITERISIEIPSNPHSKKYLETKKIRMGHLFSKTQYLCSNTSNGTNESNFCLNNKDKINKYNCNSMFDKSTNCESDSNEENYEKNI